MPIALSFVIPFLDEEATLSSLYERIAEAARGALGPDDRFEVIFVDDGSTDGSVEVVETLITAHPEVKLLELRGNFGKSAALAAGFSEARGSVVFTLDADLQDDPKEIPNFLAKLNQGYDLVSGYKRQRHDPVTKVVPSRVFNWLVRTLTGIRLHDVNCGFKAYRRVVLQNVRVYGELHRFIPVLAQWRRFRIGELEVHHHPRQFGHSKFGGGRFFRGFIDLLTVYFLLKYERRPAHFFGILGGVFTFVGFVICVYLTVLKIQGAGIGHRPLLTLGVLLIVVGVQFLATGLIAELITYHGASQTRHPIRRIVTHSGKQVLDEMPPSEPAVEERLP